MDASDDEHQLWDDDDASSGEEFEAGFGDGTSASKKPQREIVLANSTTSPTTKGQPRNGQGRLRIRTAPGIPADVQNLSTVRSTDYYKKRRRCEPAISSSGDTALSSSDEGETSDDNETEELSKSDEQEGQTSEDSDNLDQSDEEEETDSEETTEEYNRLKLPSSLLEAQWKLEEQEKQELQLIQKRDEEEQQQLTIKALHSKNQVSLWNFLVAVRIHLQKVLSDTNRLPIPPVSQLFHHQLKNEETETAAVGSSNSSSATDDGTVKQQSSNNNVTKPLLNQSSLLEHSSRSVARILLSLRHLQAFLIRHNKQLSNSLRDQAPPLQDSCDNSFSKVDVPCVESRKRRRLEFESFDWMNRESSVWSNLDDRLRKVTSWALSMADQWASKTSIKVQQTFKVFSQNPSAQVSRALRVDFDKLINKTRPTISKGSKSATSVLGIDLFDRVSNSEDESSKGLNTESYDDADFYVSLLKDTVRYNTSDSEVVSAASQVNALSARLKKQEDEKKKKYLDRQSSNGKRIRYVPIPQLLGFMTAEPMKYGPLFNGENDERLVDQLIASLFQDVEL